MREWGKEVRDWLAAAGEVGGGERERGREIEGEQLPKD